jgi:hypothetical protein
MPRTGIRNKKDHRLVDVRARAEHGGYLESAVTLLKSYEAGLERTRHRLTEQREELQRQRNR